LPKIRFDEAHRQLHHRLHIPKDREFKTNRVIDLELIDRARQQNLPFSRFSGYGFYGQNHNSRAELVKCDLPLRRGDDSQFL
jgi:hypothetical protein